MKNTQKFGIVTISLLVATIAYALIIGSGNTAPVETKALFYYNDFHVSLPVQVSYWWNVIFFPLSIIIAAYMLYSSEKVKDEPNHEAGTRKNDDYYARLNVHIDKSIALIIGIGSSLLWIITGVILRAFNMNVNFDGPVSALIGMTIFTLGGYIVFGIGTTLLEFTFELRWNDERPTMEKFISKFGSYVELGFVNTLPMLIGLTTGFVIRSTAEVIGKVFKGIKNAFKETKPANI